eukprot:scaffold80450_cov49-Cyclotella_meneghiniana.AAC.1
MTTSTSENKSNAGDNKDNADVEMNIVSSEMKKSDAEVDTQIAGANIGSVEMKTNNSTDRLIGKCAKTLQRKYPFFKGDYQIICRAENFHPSHFDSIICCLKAMQGVEVDANDGVESDINTIHLYLINNNDTNWTLSKKLPSKKKAVGEGDVLYFRNIAPYNMNVKPKTVPIRIGSIEMELSDHIPFTILPLSAKSDAQDETLLCSGPMEDDASLMTKLGVEKTADILAISTITSMSSTMSGSNFIVGLSENENDDVNLGDLAIRVQVGGQALINWITSQFPIQDMNQSTLDESIEDVSSRLKQAYTNLFEDHPMLEYVIRRFPKLCDAYKVIIYPELTVNHHLTSTNCLHYQCLTFAKSIGQLQEHKLGSVCFPVGFHITDEYMQRDLINFNQNFESLWCTAVVRNDTDVKKIADHCKDIKVNKISIPGNCVKEMAKRYMEKLKVFSHMAGSSTHSMVRHGRSECYCCMTEEEETHNRDKGLVSLTKLNTPFYTLVRYGNDKQTKKRKEVENMKQHSDLLYPVAYFGKFLEYKASEITYDELKNLAGVVTFIMAFLPQPSNLNHRFVNRRFDKDKESFISYLIGMVQRLSSSLKWSQKDKRSSVERFTLTEHELFGVIKRGKTQIVQYAPLFLLKYKPKKDREEEALNELRNKEHDHHTNFTMSNIELWEKRDITIHTRTVMCMGHRLAKLLEDVVRRYDKTDVETFIQHDVQIEFRNRIESEIGKYLKKEVCKDGSSINGIV